MREFDYGQLAEVPWEYDVLRQVALIHECKGRQRLFAEHNTKEAMRLVESARIQSTEASNRLEGIVTTSTRLRQLVQQRTAPRSRDEREIVGYQEVLKTLHESHDYIPVKPSLFLFLYFSFFFLY